MTAPHPTPDPPVVVLPTDCAPAALLAAELRERPSLRALLALERHLIRCGRCRRTWREEEH